MRKRRGLIISGTVMFVGLMAHFITAVNVFEQIKSKQISDIQTLSEKLQVRINTELTQAGYALRALSGVLTFKGTSEKNFVRAVHDLKIDSDHSGSLGVGFIARTGQELKAQHLFRTDDDGSQAQSWQLSDETVRSLKPFALRATRTGKPVLSSALNLSGDMSQRISILLYPVFASSFLPANTEAREKSASGWVYLAFSTQKFIAESFGSSLESTNAVIFEGDLNAEDAAIYTSAKRLAATENLEPSSNFRIDIHDRPWNLVVYGKPQLGSRYEASIPQGIVLFGTLNSLLLGLLIYSTINTRHAAQEMASNMTSRLETRTEELQAVVNSFPGMVSWIDRNLRYVGVNNELAQSYKRQTEDFVGEEIGKISSGESGQAFRKMVQDFFHSHENRRTTYLSLASPTGDLHFMTTLQKYHGGDRVMIVSIDITEQKNLERQVEETKLKAQHSARMSALGEMAGGMAHEINNPLTIIYAKASILKRMLAMDKMEKPKAIDALDKIEKTADRISKIIRGLRSIARDGENDPFQAIPIHAMVTDAVELCRHRLNNKDIRFDYPQNMNPALLMDCRATQIVQVLLNLLNNSYDAVLGQSERWIKLEMHADEEFVELAVSDSGPGISDSLREKIMQPFFTTKEIGKGTGLGLSISKGIAESHHGSLFLDPLSSHTRFVLRLPRRQAEATNRHRNRAA